MIRSIFIAGCLLLSLLAKSQAPVANFTYTPSSGCLPVQIQFKDVSTGTPKFWNWDLGNGQLSNQQNPTTVYYNPGKYTVTLVARNADGTNGITKDTIIEVFPSPTADFIADKTTTCLPANIQFTDRTVPNFGTITRYEWDFGDGTTSTLPNPSKLYTANGFYNVTLKVTSSTGCTGTAFKPRLIRTVSGVTANFRDTVTRVCLPPFVANFTNESSGPGTLTYEWAFGNGNTSTLTSPSNSYSAAGSYNVRLIARSDLGCSDTVQRALPISSSKVTFSGPDSACLNQAVSFQSTSSPAPLTTSWDFGDGTTSTVANPSKTFTAAGSYRIRLASTFPACADSVVKTFVVNAAAPVSFSSNTLGACRAPVTVAFTDASPGAVSWNWNFGDGGTSTAKNPTHTYTTLGTYTVSLTVTNSGGCTGTLSKPGAVTVAPPSPTISNAPAGGCIPFTFSPTIGSNSVDPIATYLWEFGEAGATSTAANPSYTYNTSGNYDLKLTVTTVGGCTGTITVTNGVRTGTSSIPAFTSNRVQACSDSVISFTNQSTPATGLSYLWSFGDGLTSTDVNPVHGYKDPKNYTVSLTSSNNGCEKTITKTDYISVLPPLARFFYSTDCRARPNVTFINTSTMDRTQPLSFLWNFGDGSPTTTMEEPVHQYPAPGKYTVSFTVNNGTCSNTLNYEISIIPEVARFNFTPSDSLCRNSHVTFLSQSSNPQNITRYQWSVDNAPYFDFGKDLSTMVNKTGKIPISLIITDAGGCSDTVTRILTLVGPTAAFTPSDTAGCVNKTITFTDQSSPAADITGYRIDFGDGTIQNFTRGPFVHQYLTAGVFSVTMKITAKTGCTDSVTKVGLIRISKPAPLFGADNNYFCKGGIIQFRDSSVVVGKLTYLWNFGDGQTSALQNPQHSYSGADSVYAVSLQITDSLGCVGLLSKPAFITAAVPKAAFGVKDSVSICPPLETKFTLLAKDYESYYWDFGDSTYSTLPNPNHFYNEFGAYKAKLVLVGKGGCLDSVEHTINLYNPRSSTITYGPLNACNELLVNFTVIPPSSVISAFNFGDGTQDTTGKTSFSHLYTSPNFYQPYLYLKDSLQCEVFVDGSSTIRVIGAEPLFSTDKKTFCDSGTVFFTNYTIGNDPVKTYTWDFGTGATSTDKEPIYSFTQPGFHLVSLKVETENGCVKTATDTVKVFATPAPTITSADVVCINTPVPFQGLLGFPDTLVKWTWSFGNGSSSALQNPSATYTTAGTYTITVEASNALACKASTTKTVIVKPLPSIDIFAEPTLPVGVGVVIPVVYSNNVVSYNWTPARDLSCTDCATPYVSPKLTTKYTVSVVDSNGCKNSRDITVSVVCNSNNYFVPNTFTPNGDGTNDVFYPRGTGVARVQSMRIFNRWGQVVFEKRNFAANSAAEGWNGLFNGKPAVSDAYIYSIEFICDNGLIIPFKGNVTLIR